MHLVTEESEGVLSSSMSPWQTNMAGITMSAGGVSVVSIIGGNGTTVYPSSYRIDLAPGTYTLTVNDSRYNPLTISGIVVTGGQDTNVDLTLTPVGMTPTWGSISGKVTQAGTISPVAGATVTLVPVGSAGTPAIQDPGFETGTNWHGGAGGDSPYWDTYSGAQDTWQNAARVENSTAWTLGRLTRLMTASIR